MQSSAGCVKRRTTCSGPSDVLKTAENKAAETYSEMPSEMPRVTGSPASAWLTGDALTARG